MARPSSQRSAVLGAVKDKPPTAVAILRQALRRPSLTAPARDAPQISGRDEGMSVTVEQRNGT
jgi:hypothetical protein